MQRLHEFATNDWNSVRLLKLAETSQSIVARLDNVFGTLSRINAKAQEGENYAAISFKKEMLASSAFTRNW